MKNKLNRKKRDNSEEIKWFITVFITTFILSLFFSFISTTAIDDLEVAPAIIILIIVILVGVIFDIIGVAVTVANEEEFHAMASKKVHGSKTSIKLIRASTKVANICADVIGDICGVLSGAISAIIAIKMSEKFNIQFELQFIMSALVASITVGGKALGKNFAKTNSTQIIKIVGKVLSISERK